MTNTLDNIDKFDGLPNPDDGKLDVARDTSIGFDHSGESDVAELRAGIIKAARQRFY